ncbi:MAG: DUF4301 family protein [Muribaculaceae bacterium]|nr:DUF4301 family protein [Muribaculaceae bacterium]
MTKFSDNDIKQITDHGLTVDIIISQLQDFQTGFPYAKINRPAIVGDGIITPDNDTATHAIETYDEYAKTHKIVKFVPASGAATRMFKDLYAFLDSGAINKTTQTVLDNIEKFAFYDELKKYLPVAPTDRDIIECILTPRGLNYGASPKALIAFHKYETESRTAAAEHFIEGALYARGANDETNIHFTVSPEHRNGFEKLFADITDKYAQQFDTKFNITMSHQLPQTDTIAANMDNTPFRNDDGTLLFRPAGHGALIENLNNIDADLIFIKNIDNICPDNARDITVYNKKMLAGIAVKTQEKIFEYIRQIDNGTANLAAVAEFINKNLGITTTSNNATTLRGILNRPLRVCGIIKNTGAPGGGPFWVTDANDTESLQIVEPGQIAPESMNILTQGEFFSPTDLVCATRDITGHKFNLTEFIDASAGFISEKSKNGRPLRAMERPGLWNGAMAHWNTIFVETPIETFTPVKTICDLLDTTHQGE